MNTFLDFILVAGIVITALILFLLFKSKKEFPKKLLIAFFGLILLFFINVYSDIHELTIPYFITYIFNDIIELAVGPIIYFYVKSLFENDTRLSRIDWAHFIPTFLFIALVSIPILISIAVRDFVFDYLEYLNEQRNWLFNSMILFLNIYVVISLKAFYKYRRAMKGQFSNLLASDIGWIERMLWGVLLVSILDFGLGIYGMFYDAERLNDVITLISVIILIFFLGYYGVNQSKILLPDFLFLKDHSKGSKSNSEFTSTLLSAEEFSSLDQKLKQVMEQEHPYLDEDLTLNKLATQIETTDKKLSMLLNQHLKTSFYDYVNKHRLESVKEKMQSSEFENLTLLGIAFESGFKSKTSFNRIFKKETGQSPSEFKKSLK